MATKLFQVLLTKWKSCQNSSNEQGLWEWFCINRLLDNNIITKLEELLNL